MTRPASLLLGAAVLGTAAPPAAAQDSPLLSGEPLLRALRGGGFNIYFRHAQTDWSQHDDLREAHAAPR